MDYATDEIEIVTPGRLVERAMYNKTTSMGDLHANDNDAETFSLVVSVATVVFGVFVMLRWCWLRRPRILAAIRTLGTDVVIVQPAVVQQQQPLAQHQLPQQQQQLSPQHVPQQHQSGQVPRHQQPQQVPQQHQPDQIQRQQQPEVARV